MARTPWVFDGYAFPTNPEEDSGWVYEHVFSEKNPLNSTSSTLHFTALKSARRQVSGYFFGPLALQQRDTFEGWYRSRKQATLVDHLGVSRRAMLIRFEARPVQDIRAYRDGRATFRFSAEFITRD